MFGFGHALRAPLAAAAVATIGTGAALSPAAGMAGGGGGGGEQLRKFRPSMPLETASRYGVWRMPLCTVATTGLSKTTVMLAPDTCA